MYYSGATLVAGSDHMPNWPPRAGRTCIQYSVPVVSILVDLDRQGCRRLRSDVGPGNPAKPAPLMAEAHVEERMPASFVGQLR